MITGRRSPYRTTLESPVGFADLSAALADVSVVFRRSPSRNRALCAFLRNRTVTNYAKVNLRCDLR